MGPRYMIDNIVLLITGALHQRPISELMPKCHPLGTFDQIEAINVASTSQELYNAVLVDTPLGGWASDQSRASFCCYMRSFQQECLANQ